MKSAAEWISGWAAVLAWLAGAVYAHGFWSTAAACFLPPWAWYLCMERALRALGWL